jgi:hypothetical protein
MIGTEVLFKLKEYNNDQWEYVTKTGTIKDKIRMINNRVLSNVVDHYVILSKKKYYFIECNAVEYKNYVYNQTKK